MSLSPSDPDSTPLPFTLTPMVVDTTLLSSHTPLVYGSGCGLLGNGEPALNDVDHTSLLHRPLRQLRSERSSRRTRRTHGSTRKASASPIICTASSSRTSTARTSMIRSLSGRRVRAYTLPKKFAISNLNSVGDLEISGTLVRSCDQQGHGRAGHHPGRQDARRRDAEPARPGRRRREGRRHTDRHDRHPDAARPASTPTSSTPA